ncbi:SDR family NAD(P)-dependent oxidoreductase [Pseudomonas aeruginosa]|uniref:SDR family oxidoreductase n=1 Tax=Pseudomonas aeruginosa TaxID=287 RepID=UPI00232F3A48|nr:SDR family NAD(P)-dependent oxidoreductase [Pseudomonas aeruginosa]MDC0845598.1 SDR family NAD(P)-dependent oxidoreductase [Pseudomonas aeruginosa]
MNTKKLAIVTGVGPGTGAAIVRRLVEDGFRVAMIARNEERLTALATELPDTYIFPTDVADIEQLELALDRIKSQLGDAAVLVHNAVGGTFGSFLEIDCGFHAIRPPSPRSSGQAFHGHLAIWPPVPRPSGRAVGAQRRRGGIVSPRCSASSISASVCALIHPSD